MAAGGKPVRLIIPALPGGPADLVARTLAPALFAHTGQPYVIENRGGAGAIIGTEAVAKSQPDGMTLGLIFISHATNPSLHASLPYDTSRDLVPVALIGQQPLLLVTHPSLKADSVEALVGLAKARTAGMLLFYGAETATAPHLAAELFKHATGTKLMQVGYKGNVAALSDAVAGQVQMMFSTINTALPQVQAGRLRALAITSSTRSDLARDIPTLAEAGVPGVEVNAWYGLVAPAGTDPAVVARFNAALNEVARSAAVRDEFHRQGVALEARTPAQFARFIEEERAKWQVLIRTAGIRPV
jgi:tripartite-type tricarboxylate transporter receptor subunit TctC